MTRWLLWTLVGLGSCQCSSATPEGKGDTPDDTGGGGTTEEYRPSVYDWLPGTTWACDWVYAANGTVYRVAHTWEFTETEFRTDCSQQIEAAYNNGEINQSVAWAAMWWVSEEREAVYSDTFQPWHGMGANVILAELCWMSVGNCEGIETIFHRDGEEHMVIQTGIDGVLEPTITCELASRTR